MKGSVVSRAFSVAGELMVLESVRSRAGRSRRQSFIFVC